MESAKKSSAFLRFSVAINNLTKIEEKLPDFYTHSSSML